MWRLARLEEEQAIVAMCRELNREDPCSKPVPDEHMLRTLPMLRAEPTRGRTVVLELDSKMAGYALLISFWSNELGGEVCFIDELYVAPDFRGRGHSANLVKRLREEASLWPRKPVAIELEVSPQNTRARALYAKLGFAPVRNAHMRLELK